MTRRAGVSFATIRTEGGLLPSDFLARLAHADREVDGLRPEDYHLAGGERLTESISRSWARMVPAWKAFRIASKNLPTEDKGTSLTRERWLLILFQELGYGRLQIARGLEADGSSYPISHTWQDIPFHLVGLGIELDKRTPGAAGAARSSPHGLVQDYLNRRDDVSWGFLSNGLVLRILRDNSSLTRQAFVEFDLQAMMEGEVYADFALLWLLAHQSRVEAAHPVPCWLERWAKKAHEQSTRLLELRGGVEEAIRALGRGFLAHPSNTGLKELLRSEGLSTQDLYREILRLVYRLLFLFTAEDRELLLVPAAPIDARERYQRHYSTQRLRRLALRVRGSRHGDLWRALALVMEQLGANEGYLPLALPALGSFLWSREAVSHLIDCGLGNESMLDAVRALAFTARDGRLRPIDYKNLGAEELGSVYESLLELHPKVNTNQGTFELGTAAGHERKITGSYYTPESLVRCLLDTALDPVLDEAAKSKDPEKAILALKVCDPACGSGHFLIAAAHRIARRLAQIRTDDLEPAPEAQRSALRDVIGHCIYGVDQNPMAVELCKVSLWIEALEPGKPLSFLDHRIRSGNSLLGTTPALIAKGIPDDAFEVIEGDDKAIARDLKKRNRDVRKRQGMLFPSLTAETEPIYSALGIRYTELDSIDDTNVAGVHAKETCHAEIENSAERRKAKLVADAWCSAFLWRKTKDAPDAITQEVFERLTAKPDLITAATIREVERVAGQHRFFHWYLAFPNVFLIPGEASPANEATGWSGGFDVVLGNPPWERIKLQEQEWFAQRVPEITKAPNKAAREKMIHALSESDPALHRTFLEDVRLAEGESVFVRNSGRYPLCGRGDVNTYAVFAETMRMILSPRGRVGCIVPSGIATDDTTKFFFQDLMTTGLLVSLYDFVNDAGLFPGVGHGRFKFSVLTLAGLRFPASKGAEFAFHASRVADLQDPSRRFVLTLEDIALLNPNTRTCPVFRTRRDADVTKAIYGRVPVLIREGSPEVNPWNMQIRTRIWHMSEDAELFRTRDELEHDGWTLQGNTFQRGDVRYLPLYEAKMVHQFDHRYGDYADHPAGSENTSLPDVSHDRLADSGYSPLPRYWVAAQEVEVRLSEVWQSPFLLGWRDICRSTDERTVIASLIPRVGCGDKFLLMFPDVQPLLIACLLGNLDSFALDFVARQKVGGTSLKVFTMKQLAVLPPSAYRESTPWSSGCALSDWIGMRVLELVYTAEDLTDFARACGFDGPPFHWDTERRFQLRCELDAAFFHLYGIPREDMGYILDTFPIVRRNDVKKYGDYRTKLLVLDHYDRLAMTMRAVTEANAAGSRL